MNKYWLFILCITAACFGSNVCAQDDKKILSSNNAFTQRPDTLRPKDTTRPVIKASKKPAKDSLVVIGRTAKNGTTVYDTVPYHSPRKATLRSALIPGWGQAYNREYWKIPIVYGIISIPTVLFFYNNSYYKKTKFAYEARFRAETLGDTSQLRFIDPELKGLSTFSLQSYRNSFRQSRDYSVIWFLLAWGLQVADATVFAHLKQFDVSKDLSMEVTPTFNNITRSAGLGLTLNLKSPPKKPTVLAR